MSQEQVQRIKVIENAVAGRITVQEASEYLNLSKRQIQRLKRLHNAEDGSWAHHGNQGRTPANAISIETRLQVEDLARGKYAGFNDTHLHEKLTKVEGLKLSRPSVQRILREAGLRSAQKRRPPKYRSRRERREQEGMLLQVDGSRHDWLEGRGPHMTLLGLVDDATNKVPAAHFQLESEDSAGYLRLFRGQVESHGIPWAIYRDQHSTLQRNDTHWSMAEQLEAVENALVLAASRRIVRPPGATPLGIIRSLAYFGPVIDEVLESSVGPEYYRHLRQRLPQWLAAQRSHRR